MYHARWPDNRRQYIGIRTPRTQLRIQASRLEFSVDARGPGIHRLAYEKTSHAGSFDVLNNSLSQARIRLWHANGIREELETANGAVLEMAGNANPIP